MFKLIRNCLASSKVLEDGEGNAIRWAYFEKLESYRVQRGLVTHKLTKKHIQWYRNKMNVRLATQLLSKSVVDSLEYVRQQNCDGFANSEATTKFIRIVNNMFDIFNSKDSESNTQYKKAINTRSAESIFVVLDQASSYIKSMKVHGKNVLTSLKRTGFKGFLIKIFNLRSLYELYVESGLLEHLSTFQLSQDPLESLFGRIRTLNGNNDNPTVSQFTSAFRKLLIYNEIKASTLANCADSLNILTVSSRRSHHSNHQNKTFSFTSGLERIEEDTELPKELNANDFLLDCCEEITIAHIASSIENKILKCGRFKCNCKDVLTNNDKVTDLSVSENELIPCISTLYVCEVANAYFNMCRNQIDFNYEALIQNIMESIDFENVFIEYFDCDISHKLGFVKYVIQEFIRLQATYIAKNLTLIEQKILCRKQLNKKIHFLGL